VKKRIEPFFFSNYRISSASRSLMGGSEEWIHPGNRLANITSGALNIVDVTVESESSFHIGMYIMYTILRQFSQLAFRFEIDSTAK
jgi:hypothetical protein